MKRTHVFALATITATVCAVLGIQGGGIGYAIGLLVFGPIAMWTVPEDGR